ncbi:MAG: two-component system response regulator, partial [Undibacterium sp.]|nr:two-component system response regulator [Undibacterium sp.]
LLLDIGKMGFPDDLLVKPIMGMVNDELIVFRKHPVRAEQLLMPLSDLQLTSRILRSQSERFDGEGFPDRLSGTAIPLGARILAVASDFDNLQIGALLRRRVPLEDAKRLIFDNAGKFYDPAVVAAFGEVMGDPITEKKPGELIVVAKKLQVGMVLSRDLVSKDGLLLLSSDHILDDRLIQKIVDFERKNGSDLVIWINQARRL